MNKTEKEIQDNYQEIYGPELESLFSEKRGRGRPRKHPVDNEEDKQVKRGRGRPRKNPVNTDIRDVDTDVRDMDNINIDEISVDIDKIDLDKIDLDKIDLDKINLDKIDLDPQDVERIKFGRGRPPKKAVELRNKFIEEAKLAKVITLVEEAKLAKEAKLALEREVESTEGFDDQDQDDESPNDQDDESSNDQDDESSNDQPVRLTPRKQRLKNYYDQTITIAKDVFGVDVNDNEKYTCSMCHKYKPRTDYFRSYSLADVGTLTSMGERHSTICKKCSKKLYKYILQQEGGHQKAAVNHWCQILNVYFSDEIYGKMLSIRDTRKGTVMETKFEVISDYMFALSKTGLLDATYWDSPVLQDRVREMIVLDHDVIPNPEPLPEYPEEFEGWSKDDLQNYFDVLEIYKYDPFIDEPLEDKKKLYHNLNGFSDEDIIDDTGKANACIDMCRSLQRLEKLNKLRVQLEKSPEVDIKEIKMLAELQEKERKSIQSYQKEWGFNRRYSINKNRGVGTLTGILKQMDTEMFEDALVNAYDIKTSNAMKLAADASWKAIFGQLNLSESEFSEIVKNQRESISKLRAELDKTKEDLRLANIEIKRNELAEKLRLQQEEEGNS